MATEAIIWEQIVDANWDQAIYTASPNNTINVAQFAAAGSGTNIAVALTPKGTGYVSAQAPDGTIAGGNARGANAVDWQTLRSLPARVASGANSTIIGGGNNTASGSYSICGGNGNTASGTNSIALGDRNVVSGAAGFCTGTFSGAHGDDAFSAGRFVSATGGQSIALGRSGTAYLRCMAAIGHRQSFRSQTILLGWSNTTTTNAEVELLLNGADRAVLQDGNGWHGTLTITGRKSDGSSVALYCRKVAIKRVGNATTLESLQTIGTDEDAGTSISVTADDTNESLRIAATGVIGETWRWLAVFHGGELGIGA